MLTTCDIRCFSDWSNHRKMKVRISVKVITTTFTCWAWGERANSSLRSSCMCAQVAERQGRYLAKLLNTLDSKPIHQQAPYQFKSLGMLAYIGGFQALSELPADIKLQGTSCIKLNDILPFFTGCVIALPSATHFLFPYSVCININTFYSQASSCFASLFDNH